MSMTHNNHIPNEFSPFQIKTDLVTTIQQQNSNRRAKNKEHVQQTTNVAAIVRIYFILYIIVLYFQIKLYTVYDM